MIILNPISIVHEDHQYANYNEDKHQAVSALRSQKEKKKKSDKLRVPIAAKFLKMDCIDYVFT